MLHSLPFLFCESSAYTKEKKAKRTAACDVLKRLGEAMISSDVASKE